MKHARALWPHVASLWTIWSLLCFAWSLLISGNTGGGGGGGGGGSSMRTPLRCPSPSAAPLPAGGAAAQPLSETALAAACAALAVAAPPPPPPLPAASCPPAAPPAPPFAPPLLSTAAAAAGATGAEAEPKDGSAAVRAPAALLQWPITAARSWAAACLPCDPTSSAAPAAPPAGLAGAWLPTNRLLAPSLGRGPAATLAALEPVLQALAMRTVFLIFSPPNVRRELPLATWAAGLPHVAFVGDTTCAACDLRLPLHAPDSWDMLPAKNLATWPAALAAYPEAEFFVKVDTDAYVVAANLFEALQLHRDVAGAFPDYMGHVFTHTLPNGDPACDSPVRYTSGGAGYVLSRRAATAMTSSGCTYDQVPGGMEDILVGRCLCFAGISPVHHGGFIAEQLSTALSSWLLHPTWTNHHPDPTVPAAFITLHGYKREEQLLELDALIRAKDVSSLRHRRSRRDGGELVDREPVDNRPIWDLCCTENTDAPPAAAQQR